MDALMVVPISDSLRIAPQQSPGLHASVVEDAPQFGSMPVNPGESQRIRNSDRSVGAHLSGEVVRRRALLDSMTPEITQEYHGSACQRFRAFLAHGITLKLPGETKHYFRKGLSCRTIAITAGSLFSRLARLCSEDTDHRVH